MKKHQMQILQMENTRSKKFTDLKIYCLIKMKWMETIQYEEGKDFF